MEFLNPTALFGLFALPLLLIPYLTRRRARRVLFSSLLLFVPAGSQKSRRLWGRIQLPPIFFLQLMLLTLLILALSEPVFSIRPTHIAIILDNSASMQALEDGQTRMALAQQRASALTEGLGASGRVELYTTAPRLEKVTTAPLDPGGAKRAITTLRAYDIGDPRIDYSQALNGLARDQKYQRIYLVTDHPAGKQNTVLRVITVGAPKSNLAVTGFDVRRSSLASNRLQANAAISNFSNRNEKVKIFLQASGANLASRELTVAAGNTATANFEGFAAHPTYEVEIDSQDALSLDNRRFAVAPPTSRNLHILAITPKPQAFASLKSISGVAVDVISPADYAKSLRGDYGLEIFHFAAPRALPNNPALFILPPENSSIVELGTPVSNLQVSSWREPHALTRYINFSLFRPTYARPLTPKTSGDVIIDSPNGALAFATEEHGVRYLALGFDPLPYLGRENLPMSIFTLNFIDWFFENAAVTAQATGEPLALGAMQPGDTVKTPNGRQVPVKAGRYFLDTLQQGIYYWQHAGHTEAYARNLADTNESDLRSSRTIELHEDFKSAGASSALFEFWPYLLLGSLLLFLLEWFITPRMRRHGRRSSAIEAAAR